LSGLEGVSDDRDYLEKCRKIFAEQGLEIKTYLVLGEPVNQILNIAEQEHCNLIAMATHGHKMLKDLILGRVADTIRHRTSTPILMIKGT
jgi:nucleotide-binding universal stress UspA family protein